MTEKDSLPRARENGSRAVARQVGGGVFRKFNSAGEMKKFFRWFFYRPRVVCAWCNKRLAWGGVFSPSWNVSHGICAGCGRYYPTSGRSHVSPH